MSAMPTVAIQRLLDELTSYARIGRVAEGGITRPCLGPADCEARQRFARALHDEGLEVEIDGAANVWGRLRGSEAGRGSIIVGSHLDTVPNGGDYDGALGTLMALELVRTLRGLGLTLRHDLEVVSFTGEEPNPFRLSTFGSRCFTGKLTPAALTDVIASDGCCLPEALEASGGSLARFGEMAERRARARMYLELHIEQGLRLQRQDHPVAVVDSVVGIHRRRLSITGAANHSGTTMMDERADALAAASELVLAAEAIGRDATGDGVATVGELTVMPNAANIIPGVIEMTVEFRHRTPDLIRVMVGRFMDHVRNVQASRGVVVDDQVILDQQPVAFDARLVKILQDACRSRDVAPVTLASMAGHDAVHLADCARSAMVFVRSPNGKSHCPEEYSNPDDIEVAGNVMLSALLAMDAIDG